MNRESRGIRQMVRRPVSGTNVANIILASPAARRVPVREETLRYLSPYLTEHINRFGAYEWNPRRVIPPINYGLEILPASYR